MYTYMNVLEQVCGFHQVLQGGIPKGERPLMWSIICNLSTAQKGPENFYFFIFIFREGRREREGVNEGGEGTGEGKSFFFFERES